MPFITKLNSVALVRERTIPTERPPPVGEVSANFCAGSKIWSKRDGTRAETRFGLSAKRTNPFKSAGVSVQSAAGSRSVRISGSNAG